MVRRPGGGGGCERRRAAAVTVICLLVAPVAMAQIAPASHEASYEQQVKAVFVYELTNYLRWPPDSSTAPFVIAVLGETVVVEPLREIAAKRKVGDREIVIRPVRSAAEAGDCQVLFIASTAPASPEDVCQAVAGKALLTIGEVTGFAARGVAVNFVLDEGRVKLEINLRALRRAGIEPSSKLLKLARLVDDAGGEP